MAKSGSGGIEITLTMPTDEGGMVGRRCPNGDCQQYFKVKPGTGLKGEVPCHCAYCGLVGGSDDFWTPEQRRYVEAVAMNHVSEEIHRMLKGLEFETKPQRPFGIGISMKVTGGPQRFHYSYAEKELETEVVCEGCSLVYAIYGAFAFCPDCGSHNSLTILGKNLEIVEKLLALADKQDHDVAEQLVGNALANVVSAFDGFGREICRVAAPRAVSPADRKEVSFQNLGGARTRVQQMFGVDSMTLVPRPDWEFAVRCFQKRHLLAHKMGVIDDAYLRVTNDSTAVVGRKVQITPDEVRRLGGVVRRIGEALAAQLLPPPSEPSRCEVVPPTPDI